MKSLKREIITIVVLLFFAVIGTYIAHADTTTIPDWGTPEISERALDRDVMDVLLSSDDTRRGGGCVCRAPKNERPGDCDSEKPGSPHLCRQWEKYEACMAVCN